MWSIGKRDNYVDKRRESQGKSRMKGPCLKRAGVFIYISPPHALVPHHAWISDLVTIARQVQSLLNKIA